MIPTLRTTPNNVGNVEGALRLASTTVEGRSPCLCPPFDEPWTAAAPAAGAFAIVNAEARRRPGGLARRAGDRCLQHLRDRRGQPVRGRAGCARRGGNRR